MEKKHNHSVCAPPISTGAALGMADWQSIEEAIEQLYRQYYQPVLRHLERLVRQHQSAEDLCQEAFLKALKHWDQLRDTTCVRGWLFQIATNTAVDYLRRQRRIRVTTLDEERMRTTIAPAQAHWEDAEPVWDALRQVPVHYRLPFVLQTLGGYTLDEIATVLGCLPATIKTRVHRARKHFRQYYID
jgi:RNA polymerase sigma-70 factor, ECF subfamily